jgi:hypothetical protein
LAPQGGGGPEKFKKKIAGKERYVIVFAVEEAAEPLNPEDSM